MFLGETFDADKIAADYAAGVLILTIPVGESAKPRNIQVTSSDTKQAATAWAGSGIGRGPPAGGGPRIAGANAGAYRERPAARRLDGLCGPPCSTGY